MITFGFQLISLCYFIDFRCFVYDKTDSMATFLLQPSHGKRQEKGQRSEWSKALSLFYDAKTAGPDVHVVQQLLAACAKVRNW